MNKKKIIGKIMLGAAACAALVLAGHGSANAQMATTSTMITISPQSLPGATVGIPYSQTISASTLSSGPFTWILSLGSLPPGLGFDAMATGTTALLSGTPTVAGSYLFTISASDGTMATTQNYGLNVLGSNLSAATTTPVTATTTTMMTTSTLEAELASLEAEAMQLEVMLEADAGSGAAGTSLPTGPFFGRDLTIGSMGPDVMALQVFLNQSGYPIASSGPGSQGQETDYFGQLTQSALAGWQAANNISPAAGYYGPETRAAIGPMLASSTATTPGATTTPTPAPTTGY